MKPIEKRISIPFPAIMFNTNVEYTEVQQASGISFILMVLIENADNEPEKLSNVLKSFNIPTDLHDLFANELCDMVKNHIVEMKNGVYDQDILNWTAGNFSFTSSGMELYRKGMILTGNSEQKNFSIVYNPLTKNFSNRTNNVSVISQPLTQIIGESWKPLVQQGENNLVGWLEQNLVGLGLKKGTQLTDVDIISTKNMKLNAEKNVSLFLGEDGIELTFSSPEEAQLFNDCYDSKTANDLLLSENGFFKDCNGVRFEPSVITVLHDVVDFYFPSETDDITKHIDSSVAINRGHLFKEIQNKNVLNCSESDGQRVLNSFNTECEMILLNDNYCAAFVPAKIACKGIGELEILLKQSLSDMDTSSMFSEIFEIYKHKDIDTETLKMIAFLSKADKEQCNYNINYAEHICSKLNTDNDKIEALAKMDKFFTDDEWKSYSSETIKGIFESSLERTTLQDIPYLDAVFKRVYKKIDTEERNIFVSIIRKFKATSNNTEIMDAVCSIGCKAEDVLSELNVIPDYINSVIENTQVVGQNPLAKSFEGCRTAFNSLMNLLGLDISNDNTEINDNYDIERFFKLYIEFEKYYKKISPYSHLAENEYKAVQLYVPVFQQFHKEASVRKMAENHPEKLDRKEVDKFIKQAEYDKVISILYYKLQFSAFKILGRDDLRPYDMINELRDNYYISIDDSEKLHHFREYRNGLQHPSAPKLQFNLEELKEWEDLILSLE